MIGRCDVPEQVAGVAARLATYVDCQSRLLGENGFAALVGGPMMSSILSGLIAIFITLIGYRMILDRPPGLRDGVTLAARLGVVLALVTSWPAFQTLVYRVAIDAPEELTATLLPAAGLSGDHIADRVQAAYDAMRVGQAAVVTPAPTVIVALPGSAPAVAPVAPSPMQLPGFQPLPQTASLFVMSTIGITAALHLVVGFLLAIGPLGILSLLFDSTLGLFNGWVRALCGGALGVLAANITSAVGASIVEAEIAQGSGGMSGDQQALITVTLCVFVIAIAMTYAGFRMASAIRLAWGNRMHIDLGERHVGNGSPVRAAGLVGEAPASPIRSAGRASRAEGVADALTIAAHRDRAFLDVAVSGSAPARRLLNAEAAAPGTMPAVPLGVAGRRSVRRQTRSASRRDAAK